MPTSSYTMSCEFGFFLILVTQYIKNATNTPVMKQMKLVTETDVPTAVTIDESNISVLFNAVTDGPKVQRKK